VQSRLPPSHLLLGESPQVENTSQVALEHITGGNALLALFVASALFAAAGFVSCPEGINRTIDTNFCVDQSTMLGPCDVKAE